MILNKSFNIYTNINMKFTIAYIDHDKEVFNKYLKPSLDNLKGVFEVISVSSQLMPAKNYNELIDMSSNNWIILTHQDVSFPPNLLESIENTINFIGKNDIGALAMIGVNKIGEYKWSNKKEIHKIETSDCCFLVINKSNGIYFDDVNFDDFHLYVEDYCIRVKKILDKDIYTILIDSEGIMDSDWNDNYSFDKLRHHSYTCDKIGFCWGNYYEYKQKLINIWGDVKTT
jgi:hypothetical protein